jgi:hypothetical protein
MSSLALEDLGTASELQKHTKAMLDRASKRPVSIPRERKGDAITLVNRALWHQALTAMESMKTLAAISQLLSDTLKHTERRRYPSDLAWLAEFDEDDLQEFFGEYVTAVMGAVTGTRSWDTVDTVIEQWRRSALVLQDEGLRERLTREAENVRHA